MTSADSIAETLPSHKDALLCSVWCMTTRTPQVGGTQIAHSLSCGIAVPGSNALALAGECRGACLHRQQHRRVCEAGGIQQCAGRRTDSSVTDMQVCKPLLGIDSSLLAHAGECRGAHLHRQQHRRVCEAGGVQQGGERRIGWAPGGRCRHQCGRLHCDGFLRPGRCAALLVAPPPARMRAVSSVIVIMQRWNAAAQIPPL